MSIIIDADEYKDKLPHITTSEVLDKHNNFHANGLFSEIIFGPKNTIQRRTRIALIDLKCRIIHPEIYKLLKRLYKPIINLVHREESYIFVKDSSTPLLTKEQYESKLDTALKQEEPKTGMAFLLSIWDEIKKIPNIDPKENTDRYNLWKSIRDLKPTQIFIRYLIVIPPLFRPIVTTSTYTHIDEINELYIECYNQSRILSQQEQFDSNMFDVAASKIQSTVNELFEQIKLKISKKQGIIRQDLLGKRIDFSSRGVISPDPSLHPFHVGIPFKMICQVYQPFLIHFIIDLSKSKDGDALKQAIEAIDPKQQLYSFTVPGATRLLKDIYSGKISPHDQLYQFLKQKLIEKDFFKDKPILLKRDPVLHREGVRAFYPDIVDDMTIHLNPNDTGAFNADFDGDSVHGEIKMVITHKKTGHILHVTKEITDLANFSVD